MKKSMFIVAAMMMAGMAVGDVICASDSTPVSIDTRAEPIVDVINISWNSAWIGGDANGTVVITDNGEEMRRETGAGEFLHALSGVGRHELTYTTYIDGIVQDEIYAVTVFQGWKYEVADGGVVMVEASQKHGDVVIPEEIDGRVVTGIGASAFKDCTDLTSVTMPGSVTSIGDYAFAGCRGLTSVIIPNNVTNVGDSAFLGCDRLVCVTLPWHLLTVGSSDWLLSRNDWALVATDSDGMEGYRSAAIGRDASSAMKLTLVGACDFAFDWKVSSELGHDYLRWYLDGVEMGRISGTNGTWNTVSVSMPAGEHTIKWIYSKNGSGTSGSDCGWVRVPTKMKGSVRIADLFPDSYAVLNSVMLTGMATEIPGHAFNGCASLTAIDIPLSVTNIGMAAFAGCSGLTSVTIPNSVKSIGDSAFNGCGGLEDMSLPFVGARRGNSGTADSVFGYIFGTSAFNSGQEVEQYYSPRPHDGFFYGISYYIPASLTTVAITDETILDFGAFSGCSGLTSVTMGNGVTSVGGRAFYGCRGLTSVTIPDSVTNIGRSAFSGCSGLSSVMMGNGVTSIGDSAFEGCSGLMSVTIPQYVCANGFSSAFSSSYSKITKIVISDGVTSIGSSAFSGCYGLASVTIPDSVTNIGSSAFSSCRGLTSITIPDSVTSIGELAFYGCSGLTSVTIPNGVTSIGKDAFYNCSGLKDVVVPQYVLDRQIRNVFSSSYSSITNVAFSSVITNIESYAFHGCSGLTSVMMPDGVTSIGKDAFYNCSGLTSVTMPNSVTIIGEDAFRGCSGLANVVIPDSVTSIGSSAFYGCSGLTSVTIPDSVTSIGNYAFSGCSGLTSVTISGSVTSIGENAFSGCSGLTSVTMPDSVIGIGSGAFSDCGGLMSVTIPQVVCDMGLSTVFPTAYQKLSSVTISDSVTNIADYAFAGCTNLQTEVWGGYRVLDGWLIGYTDEAEETIPDADKLKGICSEALKGCTALKRLEFGDRARLVSIGAEALKGCTELKTLVLPPSLTRIGDEAFMGCSYLDNVIVPGGVKSIGNRAFKNCTGFTWAQIEHGVKSIGQESFYGCWRITEVDIPSSVSSIGANAFGGDSSITKIALRGDSRKVSEIFSTYAQITEATVKSGNGALVDGLFSGCWSLESVRFIGNCPALANDGQNLYENTPSGSWNGLVTYIDKDSTGWDGTPGSHSLPMKWPLYGSYRREIRYAENISTPYAVEFDANGGTPKMQSEEQISESLFVLPNEPTREGYVFMGWWTEKNGGVKVTDETVFLTGVYETLYAHWLSERVVQAQVLEKVFSGVVTVELGEDGHIVVTLTLDVNGTVDIPDNVGPVTIDLNGHNMVGDGGLGETALPGGPAIRIVKGDGDGGATLLAIVDTSEGEKGQIAGGGESAGIEVAEDAATGVKLDVEEGVGVFNGDGSEQELKPKLVGAGKVTVPKTWKVGQKVTWKATADKGSVFARWEGPLVDSLNLTKNERRNPSLAFAVPEGFETNQIKAVFIPLDNDGLYALGITQTEFDLKETVSDVWVTDDSQSYVTATASGLPTGLKFNAKTLQITGAPTKGGVYWVRIKAKNASGYQWAENVKVTVSGDGKEAKEPKLTRTAYHPLTVICATEGGTASGTGVYAEGKKVTIKATPAKGYVFAGWYETAAEAKDGGRGAIALTSSMSVVVPEMRYVFAKFVTADEDRESIRLEVSGVEMEAAGAGRPPYQTNIWAGMYVEWPVAASALSETKVKVAGLPAGLKFTDKDIMKNGSKTEVEIPANTIYGAPTAASKIGRDGLAAPYQVKITVTTAGKASQTYQVGIVVDALPAWAVGTFNGGLANVTVAANGKISGKLMKDGETWTLSGAAFETICEWRIPYNNGHVGEEEGLWRPGDTGRSFGATVVAKYGKSVATNYVEVSETRFADATSETGYRTRGVATVRPASAPSQDSVPMEWTAWQNLWRTEPWKTMAKAFAKAPALEIEIEDGAGGTVTLKFAASGAVTASGNFVTGKDARGRDVVHSATCSSVLIPDENGAPAAYRVHIYFPPKAGKFEGHAADIPLVWNGDAFGAR